MEDEIDGARYCELVRIHRATLSRWVKEEIIVPRLEGSHGRQVFTQSDVNFGRALNKLLTRYPGRYALRQMVEVVRGHRELDEHHSPYSPPTGPSPQQEPGTER